MIEVLKWILFFILISPVVYAEKAVLAFDQTLFKKLQTQTIGQAFCNSSTTEYFVQQACKEIGAELLAQKVPEIQMQSPSEFFIRSGGALIDVRRTNELNILMINQKRLDIAKYKTFKDLKEAISKLLPRTTAFHFWLNTAYAQDMLNPPSTELLLTTFGLISQSVRSADMCRAAKEAYAACDAYSRKSASLAVLNGVVANVEGRMKSNPQNSMTLKERKLFDLSAEAFEKEMRFLTIALDGTEVYKYALKSCPAQNAQSQNAWDDFLSCRKKFQDNLMTMQNYTPDELRKLRGTDQDLAFFLGQEPPKQIPLGPTSMPSPQR